MGDASRQGDLLLDASLLFYLSTPSHMGPFLNPFLLPGFSDVSPVSPCFQAFLDTFPNAVPLFLPFSKLGFIYSGIKVTSS